jgi:hypothetical protein
MCAKKVSAYPTFERKYIVLTFLNFFSLNTPEPSIPQHSHACISDVIRHLFGAHTMLSYMFLSMDGLSICTSMKTNEHHSIYPRGLVFAVIVGDEESLSAPVGLCAFVGRQNTKL